MPIATDMSAQIPGPLSPISPRITKAAFFRARSPPIEASAPQDISARFNLQARIDPGQSYGRYSPDSMESADKSAMSNGEGSGRALLPPRRSNTDDADSIGGTTGHGVHTPPLPRPTPQRSGTYETISSNSLSDPRAGNIGAMSAPESSMSDESGYSRSHSGELGIHEEGSVRFAGGSDEMLMTLLAGQAAVDCEALPVGGWEEVESWKKELSLLSNRLESLVARHQREVKILTAARTLQKLNNQNKRMSKQTMESLENSEKRVEAAEREVLVLRDREASLRRRLMEHWSGVMAWEVRRLERASADTQARFDRQSRQLAINKDRDNELLEQVKALEEEVHRRAGRVAELEENVVEMGRRERAIEEEVRELEGVKVEYERNREGWSREKGGWDREKGAWEEHKRSFEDERQGWLMEKRMLSEAREAALRQSEAYAASPRMSDKDRMVMEQLRTSLGGMLSRKGGVVGEGEVVQCLEEVGRLLERRENEVASLKEEMREVNMGLEEEVRRVRGDRDVWKGKAEKADALKKDDVVALERRMRDQSEQISDLTLRNETLSSSLNAAQTAVSSMKATSDSNKSLQNRVNALTNELDSIAGQFTEVWPIIPRPNRRAQASLIDLTTGQSNAALASPSRALDIAALQAVYNPTDERFAGIDEMLNRVRGMVDDGKLMVERLVREGQEKELHKTNAARAKKLAEDSRRALETYQQQVAVLEDRLAKTGSSDSRFLDELNSLRSQLDNAQSSKRQLEQSMLSQRETVNRLAQANDTLSAKALSLAEDAEEEKRTLSRKLGEEVDGLKKMLSEVQEEADELRMRGQSQRIQLLDELNSLQAEVGDLRKQLRVAQR